MAWRGNTLLLKFGTLPGWNRQHTLDDWRSLSITDESFKLEIKTKVSYNWIGKRENCCRGKSLVLKWWPVSSPWRDGEGGSFENFNRNPIFLVQTVNDFFPNSYRWRCKRRNSNFSMYSIENQYFLLCNTTASENRPVETTFGITPKKPYERSNFLFRHTFEPVYLC